MDTTVLIPTKKTNSTMKWIYLSSFILSIIAVILGTSSLFLKSPTLDAVVFPFDAKNVIDPLQIGNTVSITKDGKLQVGAGITITTGIKEWKDAQYKNLHSVAVTSEIFTFAYDGTIVAVKINEKGTVIYETSVPLPPTTKSGTRFVDDMKTLGDNTVAILGSNEIVACKVTDMSTSADIKCFKGSVFTEGFSVQPEMDSLDDKCVALSYFKDESGDIKLATRIACLQQDMSFTLTEETIYSKKNYIFHGIAALNSNHYVVAKSIDANMTSSELIFNLITVNGKALKIGPEVVLKNHTNFGFFDMDNLNDHHIIVTFIDGNLNNGLQSVLLVYDSDSNRLSIGPMLDNQDGGASGTTGSGLYNFIHVRVISETHFAVFYSDNQAHGATAVCLGVVTPANDLLPIGSEYIVSEPMTDPNTQYFWLAEAAIADDRLVLIESLTSEDPDLAHAEMHILDIKSLPLGIVTDISSSTVSVAISGKLTIPLMSLETGRNYYSDSNGNLIKGEFVGSLNTDSYYIYEHVDNKILSNENLLGFALDEKTLFLKMNNYVVCCYQRNHW